MTNALNPLSPLNGGVVTLNGEETSLNFISTSLWGQLPRQEARPILPTCLSPKDTLALSPTALEQYTHCPRKFFYASLLKLKPKETETSLSLGLLVHEVMEAFNQAFTEHQAVNPHALYTEDLLNNLLASCQMENGEPPLWMRETSQTRLANMDTLTRLTFLDRLQTACQDLARKGYFSTPVTQVKAEKKLEFAFPEIPRIRWVTRVDALLERQAKEGTPYWEIVDYKFYGPHAFSQKKAESRESTLAKVLNPIPEWTEHPLTENNDSEAPSQAPTKQQFKQQFKEDRLFQLPLYFYGLEQDEHFTGSVERVYLQIIRPLFPDNPSQGAIAIDLSVDQLRAKRTQFLNDLNTHIVKPLFTTHTFMPLPSRQNCSNCPYLFLCPKGILEDSPE